MGLGYQETDRNVIDYDLWFDEETQLAFRGPRNDLSAKGGIVCIGAAQTFGRFVEHPFPNMIAEFLQTRVLNLGVSGAGPEFYLERPRLMDCLKHADVVIVQAMSARSVSVGRFRTQPMNKGVLSFVDGDLAGKPYLAQTAYQLLRETEGEEAFNTQVESAQKRWLEQYQELYDQISGRTIFLWLSTEYPPENLNLAKSSVGHFPHFLTAPMVDAVERMGYEPLICVLRHMAPQVLVNDRTGVVEDVFDKTSFPNRPSGLRALNTYYATQELHKLAAKTLFDAGL